MRQSTAARDGMLATANAALGTTAKAKGYTGAMPASPDAPATGTRLFTIALAAAPFQAAAGGQMAIADTDPAPAEANGTLGYVRFEKGDGTGVYDIPASEWTVPGALAIGTSVELVSLTITLGVGA